MPVIGYIVECKRAYEGPTKTFTFITDGELVVSGCGVVTSLYRAARGPMSSKEGILEAIRSGTQVESRICGL